MARTGEQEMESAYEAKWDRLTSPCCPLHDDNECGTDDEPEGAGVPCVCGSFLHRTCGETR